MSEDQDNEGVSPRREVPDATDVDDGIGVDPLGDADRLREEQAKKNFAKVGSARPTTLLYTYGPGAIIDLPHFTIMPSGLDDWERIWRRRDADPATIHAPRLLEAVQIMLGHQVRELRRGPAFAETVTISACPRGFSPSGCAAPAATCWPRSAASSTVTTTPTPSAPIRQSSNTSTAPGV